jgi:hypothetical protein
MKRRASAILIAHACPDITLTAGDSYAPMSMQVAICCVPYVWNIEIHVPGIPASDLLSGIKAETTITFRHPWVKYHRACSARPSTYLKMPPSRPSYTERALAADGNWLLIWIMHRLVPVAVQTSLNCPCFPPNTFWKIPYSFHEICVRMPSLGDRKICLCPTALHFWQPR